MIVMPAMPLRNQNVGLVYHGMHFTEQECDRIVASAKGDKWQPGAVGSLDDPTGSIDPDARSCLEQRLPVDRQSGWPLNKILNEIGNVNAAGWRFDLTGFVSDDMPYLMAYAGTSNDHYDWHLDMGRAHTASRKLSFSLQLSRSDDYEGGDLEFQNMELDRDETRKKGTLVVFPPYWGHRVKPVTSGKRHVVVGWIHGPSFR